MSSLYDLALQHIAYSYLPSFEYFAVTDLRKYLPPTQVEDILRKMQSLPWDSNIYCKVMFQWNQLKNKPRFNVFAANAYRRRQIKMRACQCSSIILCFCGE